MARRAAPFRVYERDKSNGYAWIDIRSIPGVDRIREALVDANGRNIPYRDERTGRAPSRAAHEAATRRYAELARGRTLAPSERVLTVETADELVALWLDATETPSNRKSIETKATYGRTWRKFFGEDAIRDDLSPRWRNDPRTALERMLDDAVVSDFAMHRLTCVLRKTVKKELVALFEFFEWAKLHKKIGVIPMRPKLPKKEPGVRSGPQRAAPVEIEAAEARAIIAALPEMSDGARSKRADLQAKAFPVRDVFDFMWEMTWRPSTIARLSVPKNWAPGRTTVTLQEADDKARYGREVTLTDRALAILEKHAPAEGLIFGEHDYRAYLKAAALKVLPKSKALDFARYDFRHGAINDYVEMTGNLQGAAYLAGHLQLTTTNAYAKAKKRLADRAVEARNAANAAAAPADLEEGGGDDDGGAAAEGGTMRARPPGSDEKTSVFQSGRVDSNHRPLDPQPTGSSQASESTSEEGPTGSAESRNATDGRAHEGARSGHAVPEPIRDSIRARIIEDAMWARFDALTYDLLEDSEDGR